MFGTLNCIIHINFIQQLLIILWRRTNFLNRLHTKTHCTQIKKDRSIVKRNLINRSSFFYFILLLPEIYTYRTKPCNHAAKNFQKVGKDRPRNLLGEILVWGHGRF